MKALSKIFENSIAFDALKPMRDKVIMKHGDKIVQIAMENNALRLGFVNCATILHKSIFAALHYPKN